MKFKPQRWKIYDSNPTLAQQLATETGLHPLLTQVLINRGYTSSETINSWRYPDEQKLTIPWEDFKDLRKSVELLKVAIAEHHPIAICGDYDADGMTSTALLIRALRRLGAKCDYAIPSRMREGYGINERIVEDFYQEGYKLILTVDNGISAHGPIAKAKELGLMVIITDHHDLPKELPIADAILNPKLIREKSLFSGVAGVGVAYILAFSLANELVEGINEFMSPLLDLYTLGTIADLAPITGINRRWVKRGLKKLPNSHVLGIQALIKASGLQSEPDLINRKSLKPDDIGFRLGPRINAVGRLDDPQVVIELLTTDDLEIAKTRADQCEKINQYRQKLCEEIEQEAIALIENENINWIGDRVLVLVEKNWHHGVIGIVASRLVERYGVPVFIGTYEDEEHIRGSARGIEEFNVFQALEFCQEEQLLLKYGGHKAAGGFSLLTQNLANFKVRLSLFAHQLLEPNHLKPLIKVDCLANFKDLTIELYNQIDELNPWGIENESPIFWTPNVRVVSQQRIKNNHLKLTLSQDQCELGAIAWRWGDYFPLPPSIDIAYRIGINRWNQETKLQLELIGLRKKIVEFNYKDRVYICQLVDQELIIKNDQGTKLFVQLNTQQARIGKHRDETHVVDINRPPYSELINIAQETIKNSFPD